MDSSFRMEMNRDILQELVMGILAVMRKQLVRIVLYGSVARGADTKESDVDVALIVKGTLDEGTEDKLSDFIVDMNLKYDKVFSIIDIERSKMDKWGDTLPFYRNINEEGIVLWKAA